MRNCGLAVLIALFLLGSIRSAGPAANNGVQFKRIVIDANGPADIWLKTTGDLNGNGRPDLVAGGTAGGGLVWYENPSWKRHTVDAEEKFGTDGEVVDVDGDGDNDLVVLTREQVVWYENPSWKRHSIAALRLHDIEVGDLDGDGKPDIVGRNQSAFKAHGNEIHIFRQESPAKWTHRSIPIPEGEGLCLADMDGDGRPDVVIGQYWLRNPGDVLNGEWERYQYAKDWTHPHVYVAVGDINGDGRPDIVLSPAELAGEKYRISWFEAPEDPKRGPWTEHIVDEPVEAVHHFIGVGDFNRDDHLDIATAEMVQGEDPDEVRIYINEGKGRGWRRQVIATTGSHSMRVVDVDGGGYPDLYGANWRGSTLVELWKNLSGERTK